MWVNSADDFINPPELGIAEKMVTQIRRGKFVLIPISDQTHGHGTHTWAAVWKDHLAELLKESERHSERAAHRVPSFTALKLDPETRCAHWHSPLDVIAIKMKCCGVYYACKDCHDALAGHAAEVWPRDEWEQPAVLCGVCGTEMSVRQYLGCANRCPSLRRGIQSRLPRAPSLLFRRMKATLRPPAPALAQDRGLGDSRSPARPVQQEGAIMRLRCIAAGLAIVMAWPGVSLAGPGQGGTVGSHHPDGRHAADSTGADGEDEGHGHADARG